MKYLFKYLILFSFFIKTILSLDIELIDSKPIELNKLPIIQLEIFLNNESEETIILSSKVQADSCIVPIQNKNQIVLEPFETRIITFYFKIEQKILAGAHPINILFFEGNKKYEVSRSIIVKPNTNISLDKYCFNTRVVKLAVNNNSNHSITVLDQQIDAYSSKPVNYKFNNPISQQYYLDRIPVYYNNKEIQILGVMTRIPNYGQKIKGGNEEFLFPIHIGTVFSNNKSKNSYTFYLNGGGQFSKNQELNFKFSVPIYSGQDPYLFYDPTTAIFFVSYKFKDLKILLGDSYFENNNYLYYRTGRGYVFDYNNPDTFRMRFGYVTKNKFYNSKVDDFLFTLEKKQNPTISYYSFNRSNHYNQNLGISWDIGDNRKGVKTSLQLFNTDFDFSKDHSGILGTFSVYTDNMTANARADYLGDAFYGMINSELRLSGNIQTKFKDIKLSTQLFASYQDLFPINNPEVKITQYSGGITKSIWDASNSLNVDYLQYDNEILNRKNLSGYYGFSKSILKNWYINFNQGVTYSQIKNQEEKNNLKTYSKFQLNYHINRWNSDFGFLSQVRYFSDSTKLENSFYLGSTYNFDSGKFYVNFSFSNSSYQYKPYINANYKTRFKGLDIELDYTLIPLLSGYDWRSMVKIDFTRLFKITKEIEKITRVYDTNTKALINNLLLPLNSKEMIEIKQGSIKNNFNDEELQAIQFASHETQRKFKKTIHKNYIENEYTYHVDYRVTLIGHLIFKENILRRASLDKLILNQPICAESESGEHYYGTIQSDGRYVIPGLPIGRYKISLITRNLPEIVKIEEKTITTTYENPKLHENIIISY